MSKLALSELFKKATQKFNMTKGQKGVLLGYSGGADSSALLHLFSDYCTKEGLYFHAVHINHGIRGEEAKRDAEFCRRECEKKGVPFTLIKADIPALAKKSGRGLEEEARIFRYSSFLKMISENPRLTCIATAHNADDNAETVLFNLARGSGIAGLCGIPPVREYEGVKVIRPLILSLKSEICGYCDENGIEYIFDSTNNDTAYTRNFIRHDIIPKFNQINSDFLTAVARSGELLRRDNDYLGKEADRFLNENSCDGRIPAAALAELHEAIASRVVLRLFAKLSDSMLEKVHIESILSLVKTSENGSEVSLPDKVKGRIIGNELSLVKGPVDKIPEFRFELREGVNRFENPHFSVLVAKNLSQREDLQKDNETLKNIYKLSICTRVNSDRINRGLFVRSRMDGDSYVFGKMTRRLKKLYNDRGYDKEYRAKNPIFCDLEGIIWVPEFPPADRVAENADTDIIYYFN